MKNVVKFAFAVTALVVMAIQVHGAGRDADNPNEEAMKLATKITEEGAGPFETFNAQAMADYYLDTAELALVTREGTGLKTQAHKGKAEIEKFYAEAFKKPETIKSKNIVEYAKFLAPDVLAIAGTFD